MARKPPAASAPDDVQRDFAPPKPWLVADIGGTHARFGWLDDAPFGDGAPEADDADRRQPIAHVATLPVAGHAGPAAAARAYLAQLAAVQGSRHRPPRAAAFGVATPVTGDRVQMTNSGWSFSQRQVRDELGVGVLHVLNDFEALALSLPGLQPTQLRAHAALPPHPGTLAVVGPGTGLGVAGLVCAADGWIAVPGEGGHATLAAGDDYESAVLAAARRELRHVSAERLLSGIGLPLLHRSVAAVGGRAAPALAASAIVEAGLARSDADCSDCIDVFCALLGGFAGNVALTLGARGGVYLGGGILPRLGERFFASRFRERFDAKGRYETYLRAIPTALITDTGAALAGAAAAIAQGAR